MKKQSSQSAKEQVNMETILYRIIEVQTYTSIIVLTYFIIVVLTCCRTVVWMNRFCSAKKQGNKVVNHFRNNDLQQHINNYLLN